MLAPSFMTAEALGITEEQLSALIKTLAFFERGEVPAGQFHMQFRHAQTAIREGCGTAVCIVGWCDHLAPQAFYRDWNSKGIYELFTPLDVRSAMCCTDPAKGAHALRNYLTTGDADWAGVMASQS